jgi:hypothetical protein
VSGTSSAPSGSVTPTVGFAAFLRSGLHGTSPRGNHRNGGRGGREHYRYSVTSDRGCHQTTHSVYAPQGAFLTRPVTGDR